MCRRLLVLVGSCALFAFPAGLALASAPIAVSPGSDRETSTPHGCPTFSWGEAAGAESYELLVYRVEGRDEGARPVLAERLPGSVESWTPPLHRCLATGQSYAWMIGGRRAEGSTTWSEPRLFRVAAGPTAAELAAAAALLGALHRPAEAGRPADPKGAGESEGSVTDPVARAVDSGTLLSVEGNVAAISFSGDGSALTGLDPASLVPGTADIDITGSAAGDALVLASLEAKLDSLLALATDTAAKVDGLVTAAAAAGGSLDVVEGLLFEAKYEKKTRELCWTFGGGGGLEVKGGIAAESGGKAEVGVFVYGSGGRFETQGKTEGEVKVGLTGAAEVSYTICFDKTRDEENPVPSSELALARATHDLDSELVDTLVNLGVFDAATRDVDEARITTLLGLINGFDPSLSPIDLLTGEETVIADLGAVLPIPQPFRSKVTDFRGSIDDLMARSRDQILSACEQVSGVYVNLEPYPAAFRQFFTELCDSLPAIDIQQLETLFGNLGSLHEDLEMAFATCLASAQLDFTIPPLSTPAIDPRQITVSVPPRTITILGETYNTFPGFSQTYTTFPGFASRQIYAGDDIPVIDVAAFITCLGDVLTP